MKRFQKPNPPPPSSSSSSPSNRPISVMNTQNSLGSVSKNRSKSYISSNTLTAIQIRQLSDISTSKELPGDIPPLCSSDHQSSYQTKQSESYQFETHRGISLSYRFKGLTQCPTSEWNHTDNITSIILSNNCLTDFPDQLCILPFLRTLSLSKNQIARISPKITRLKTLESLNLSSNLITTESVNAISWDKIPSLKSLLLIGNLLDRFPESLIQSDLETLSVSNNEIDAIPKDIVKMTKLQWLGLSHNRLTCLEPLYAMHHMSGITFSHNFGLHETEDLKRRIRHLTRTMRFTPPVHIEPHVEMMTRVRALTQDLDRQLVRELARHSGSSHAKFSNTNSPTTGEHVDSHGAHNTSLAPKSPASPHVHQSQEIFGALPAKQPTSMSSPNKLMTLGRSINLNDLI